MNEEDKAILLELQNNFPLCKRPFKLLASRFEIEEEEFIEKVRNLKQKGMIRKIGPKINVRKMQRISALIALKVKNELIENIAIKINEFDEVSHNYERTHDYNIWFTLSVKNKEKFDNIIKKISKLNGVEDIIILPTTKFFKLDVRFNLNR